MTSSSRLIPDFLSSNKVCFYLFIGAIIIAAPSLYNRYPLLFSDSGNYMERAFTLIPSVDRPIGYSFFIRAVTWLASFWPVVIAQGLLSSWLIYLVLKDFVSDRYLLVVHFCSACVLASFSSLGWYASQLMPDVFTSLLVLILYLLLFARLSKFNSFILFPLLGFFLTFHYSHFAMVGGMLLVFSVLALLNRLEVKTKHLAGCWLALLLSWQSIFAYNYVITGKYYFSKSSNVFLMGRLSETGILNQYLKDNCAKSTIKLCDEIDQLPSQAAGFVWWPTSPFNKDGTNWEQSNEAYGQIVADILKTPKYWPSLIWQTGKSTFKQLFHTSIGSGIFDYDGQSSPYLALKSRKAAELNEYIGSRQNFKEIDFNFINRVDGILLIAAIIVIVIGISMNLVAYQQQLLMLCVASGYFFNAMVTASLANVSDRLQARMTWLILLVAVVVLLDMVQKLRTNDGQAT